MTRDQRVRDNFTLVYAQEIAIQNKRSLYVLFNIEEKFPNFNTRNASFMFTNLELVEKDLNKFNIQMILTKGPVTQNIPKVIAEFNISKLITDFSPLKISKKWLKEIQEQITIPIEVVDNHNIVPCWLASSKQEYSARTIRPKIHKLLEEFFTPLPEVKVHPIDGLSATDTINWKKEYNNLKIDNSVKIVNWIKPGEKEAENILQIFINNKIKDYSGLKNDPTEDVLSNLSPFLHFGQISPQRVAWDIMSDNTIPKSSKDVFIEELIVRRELADNFCYYNEKYDNVEGFHEWAQKSLNKHLIDKREFDYSLEEFDKAKTHDDLWNAAQLEMVKTGKMHGYLRMYWAKKILEWTENPQIAQKIAIELNDKYELDGRDPNGYTGIAWSIGGIHDRPWGPERPIFGLVRYMNYAGAKRKFKIANYIQKIHILET